MNDANQKAEIDTELDYTGQSEMDIVAIKKCLLSRACLAGECRQRLHDALIELYDEHLSL